ncbi:hypothetical protein HPP92_025834 [Vanilla planifolia]|uniref:Uncharacterized protein n=1 Tax=Vanilla planifolia TaxID=51239 RepID=A0A835PG33_VANPL|nr:hypothetical protein HPP92_025834 [Vanilla planifolia]
MIVIKYNDRMFEGTLWTKKGGNTYVSKFRLEWTIDNGAASTPIIGGGTFYYLNLESINVNGGKHIIIKPSKDENLGSIIINFSITFTYIDGETIGALTLKMARDSYFDPII